MYKYVQSHANVCYNVYLVLTNEILVQTGGICSTNNYFYVYSYKVKSILFPAVSKIIKKCSESECV